MAEGSGARWGVVGAAVFGGLLLVARGAIELMPAGARLGGQALSQADHLRHVDEVLGVGDEARHGVRGLPDELASGRSVEEIRALGAPSEAAAEAAGRTAADPGTADHLADELYKAARDELLQAALEAGLQPDPALPDLSGTWQGHDEAGPRTVRRVQVQPSFYRSAVIQGGGERVEFEQYGQGQVCTWTETTAAVCWHLVEATTDHVGARSGARVWRDRRTDTEGRGAPGG